MIVLDGEALRAALPVDAAVDALEAAFREAKAQVPKRQRLSTPHGDLLVMPAWDDRAAGVKLMGFGRENTARGLPTLTGTYALMEANTLKPRAIVDGGALTALRTGAVSALATRWLARDDARHLVIFGAGVQAMAHLEAMTAVRPITRVTVVPRTPAAAKSVVERARALGVRAEVGEPEAVREAEIVCTCTTSAQPLFAGSLLPDGVHVNAVGAYRPDMRELDAAAIRRAKVVVERRDAALAEAGDLLQLGEQAAQDAIAADLSDVVRGRPVRRSRDDITLLKSVGLAMEDLAVARAAVDAVQHLKPEPRPGVI